MGFSPGESIQSRDLQSGALEAWFVATQVCLNRLTFSYDCVDPIPRAYCCQGCIRLHGRHLIPLPVGLVQLCSSAEIHAMG